MRHPPPRPMPCSKECQVKDKQASTASVLRVGARGGDSLPPTGVPVVVFTACTSMLVLSLVLLRVLGGPSSIACSTGRRLR
ncbi:hypothetical protein E2C01_057461 [Portunus trituberculatus]|uniref:Uncharacterized protein n=1 Tax=Portunus trituberculatus TaxID=210409 RepID=A0A5B7H023_PORTR|nr:hypothetical protein [Portunus trituberculatus]